MAESTAQQQQYPNLNPYAGSNGNGSLDNAKNTAMNTATQAMDGVKNSQTYQSLANGPMAEKARNEATTTQNEFSNLAASRQTPSTQTANGQSLTHYHSLFYNLLSWENPRATAISYVAIVAFIFATRYVPLVRYGLKMSYIILGITAALEIAGKLVMGGGLASKMRPQKYYTIPHETLESMMTDLVELANFFVIEFQRIVFAENVSVTIGAFATTLITYFLIKITPAWGLALLFTTLAYFVPLAYLQNKELVDHHLNNAQDIISKQSSQIRDIAAQHTNKAMEASQGALKTYGARASEMVGQAKKSAVEKGYVKEETAAKLPGNTDANKADFPSPPSTEPVSAAQHDGTTETEVKKEEQEPLLAA